MKALWLWAFLLVGCAAEAQQHSMPTIGTALLGLNGFYEGVCHEPADQAQAEACTPARGYLATVIEWYNSINEGLEPE